jgi:hypothetical protein
MAAEFWLIAEAGGFSPEAQNEMRAHLAAQPSVACDESSFLLFTSAEQREAYLQVHRGQVRGSSLEIYPAVSVSSEVTLSTIGGREDQLVRAFAAWVESRWPCHLDRYGKVVELDELLWYTRRDDGGRGSGREFPHDSTLDDGRFTIVQRRHGGRERGIYAVERAGDAEQRWDRYWVVIGQKQTAPYAEIARRLALPIPGVAPLVHVGPVIDVRGTHDGLYDGLLEQLPDGVDTDEDPPHGADAIDAAIALAEILVQAHERSWTIFGIRPETVFLAREAGRVRFSGIAPRCEAFWASAQPPQEAAPPAFTHFYFPAEILSGKPPTPASDVFSLCATLAHWESDHPFAGSDIVSRMGSVLQGRRTAWTGPPALRPIVDSGLASDPSRRPSASELIAALTRLR